MYDAITPADCPPDGDLYAGYVNGRWPSYGEMVERFPHAVHVSIAVSADADAQVLDVERFDATPEQSVDWVIRQRSRGRIPSVYANTSTWPAVWAAFNHRQVAHPIAWMANYSMGPLLPAGAVALQYLNTPGYDRSVVADYWPGIDPMPPAPMGDDDVKQILSMDAKGTGWVLTPDLTSRVGVPSLEDFKHLLAQTDLYVNVPLSDGTIYNARDNTATP